MERYYKIGQYINTVEDNDNFLEIIIFIQSLI